AAKLRAPADERRIALPIGHVITERLRSDGCRRHLRYLAGETGGCGVDDEIVGAARDVAESDALHVAQLPECRGEGFGPVRRAVGDDDDLRLEPEKRGEHAACSAARAD